MSLGAAVLMITAVACAVGPVSAASCKALKGEMVGFGEAATRDYAENKLKKAIASWEERTGKKAKPRNRTVDCKVYIEFLGEYECKAEAVVCS
jgi:hypothetical protein